MLIAVLIGAGLVVIGLFTLVVLANNKLQRENRALNHEAKELRRTRDEARFRRDGLLQYRSEIEQRLKDSQRSLDTLGAELLKVRADRDGLKKTVSQTLKIYHKLGEGLQTLYATLKLTGPESDELAKEQADTIYRGPHLPLRIKKDGERSQ